MKYWTNREVQLLRKHFPTGGSKEVMKYVDRSRLSIQKAAKRYGIAFQKPI